MVSSLASLILCSLAPPSVKCIFAWTKGNAVLRHNASIPITEVVEGKVGIANLKGLLEGSLKPRVEVIREGQQNSTERDEPLTLKIMVGESETSSGLLPIAALLGAMEHTMEDGRNNAIWRCTTMRSASRREDMVYSIMGLFDVTIKAIYSKPPDLDKAVVEMTKAVTQKGQKAEWLGVAPAIGPAPRMSAMPYFPTSNDRGPAYFRTNEGKEVKAVDILGGGPDAMWWWLKDAPKATIHDDGDVTFSGRAISITLNAKTVDGVPTHDWEAHPSLDKSPYAIVTGTKERYLSGIFGWYIDPNTTLLMLVKELEPGRFQNVGYVWADEYMGKDWNEKEFRVGG